ncbi:hypothetical protein HDC94_000072 [Leifsonia sp. AK011]|uniref:hypothetical protein n=1 Tax=Leifsonia sp. AK011 TaxID=2723075 RepID=UPI0015C89E5B|nr:hypothetical protein [Leifsonia sp. AK011]NYF08916.1 hypothetical protein [Leifsonia sp. AK011]
MTEPATPSTPTRSLFNDRLELIVAILLGLVSIATAYASFQSALYDGKMTQNYTIGSNKATEAESLYLEGNQQYVQDSQLINQLTDLSIDSESSDPAIAASAQAKYDTIYFQSVSPELESAIQWADAQNEADPELWYSPLDNEDYLDHLFGGYQDLKAEADAVIQEGDGFNDLSDRLTLNTVLMAIALFLLGVAAVVRATRTKLILGGVAVAIFLTAAILTAFIPFVGLG